jgi:acetolactate synthase I/II/III large subunit
VYPMVGPGMSYAQMVTGDHIQSRQVPVVRVAETSEMF